MNEPEWAQKRDQYDRQGYLHPVDLMSADDAGGHHQRLIDIEARHGPMHYRVKPYLVSRSAYEIATSPNLLGAVESILGPDILLWDGAYIIKEPQTKNFVSWHQDLTYWGLEADSEDDIVSAWVALTPALRENGCMRFVRGSHKGDRYPHVDTHEKNNVLHRGQTIREAFSEEDIDHLELAPGQASLHHGWAVHSSNPNTSDIRRAALNLNYIKPSVRQVVSPGESAILVRGEDRYKHFKPEPVCETDFAPANVAFQHDAERRKHAVYDTA